MTREDQINVRQTIARELISDDSEVRAEYLKHFSNEISRFTDAMTATFLKWRELDARVRGDKRRAHVSALVYSAITLQILSMKLFLSGCIIPAGNLQRQVLETIALALLCSRNETGVLDKYMANMYRSNKAISDVQQHAKILKLHEDALVILKEARDFYHKYSHPNLLTIAIHTSFSGAGDIYVGASFDKGKLEQYRKEVAGRIGLSEVFGNFVDGVTQNVATW